MQKHRSKHREEKLVPAHSIREKSSLQQAWQDKASLGQQLLLLLITIPGSKELSGGGTNHQRPTPQNPHLHSLPKQCHLLGTQCSNTETC